MMAKSSTRGWGLGYHREKAGGPFIPSHFYCVAFVLEFKDGPRCWRCGADMPEFLPSILMLEGKNPGDVPTQAKNLYWFEFRKQICVDWGEEAYFSQEGSLRKSQSYWSMHKNPGSDPNLYLGTDR